MKESSYRRIQMSFPKTRPGKPVVVLNGRLWSIWILANAAVWGVAFSKIVTSAVNWVAIRVPVHIKHAPLYEDDYVLIRREAGALFLFLAVFSTLTGIGQWMALRQSLDRVEAGWWIPVTVAGMGMGAVTACTLAQVLAHLLSDSGWEFFYRAYLARTMGLFYANTFNVGFHGRSPWALEQFSAWRKAGLNAVAGIALGTVVGSTQWLMLRRRFQRAGWWVLAGITGWTVGWVTFLAIPTTDSTIGRIVFAALCGAIVGGTSGAPLIRLQRRYHLPVTEQASRRDSRPAGR